MASGITLAMRYIRPRPPEWVVHHTYTAGWDRRHVRTKPTGAVRNRLTPVVALNEPYRNPARDEKMRRRDPRKGRRRLRAEVVEP